MTTTMPDRLAYNVAELSNATGISETVIRECIAGTSKTYPPLRVKRVKKPGSRISRIYITRAQAEDWLASFPDA